MTTSMVARRRAGSLNVATATNTRQVIVAAPRRSSGLANVRAKAEEQIRKVRASANGRVAAMKAKGERKLIMYGSAGVLGVAERSGALAWVPRVMDSVPNTVTIAGVLTIAGAFIPGRWGERVDMVADTTTVATIYSMARGMTVSGDIVSGPRKRKRALRDIRERVRSLESRQTAQARAAEPDAPVEEGFEDEDEFEYV